MKLTFLGACHEVTGSCTLIEINGKYGLVDYGMEQGRNLYENEDLPVKPGDIDFLLLTHAHIDHSGMIPLLYKNGFQGQVFSTDVTAQLCQIMLRDSAHIQMQEAEWKSRKAIRAGGSALEPVYDINDAEGALELFVPCTYGQMVDVAPGVQCRFTDIGHLLGSSCIEVWLTEGGETRKIVFSGDVGNINQPILKDPNTVDETDYLLIESTYGDRLHPERPDYISILADYIQRTFDRGGNVVIPSFAVGRTQELLYFIREIKEQGRIHGHDGFSVYVDSPLANEATRIFQNCNPAYLDEDARALINRGINPLVFPGLKTSISADDSKAINFDPTPKVILSASGMCDAGRIRHHLKHNLWRGDSTVLFVGYQSEGTLGRILHDGAKTVKLFGEDVAVHAEIGVLPGISGHADKAGLLAWIDAFSKKPRQVFVNHGEDTVTDTFAQTIQETFGIPAYAPYSGAAYDLLAGEFLRRPAGIPIERSANEVAMTEGRRRGNALYARVVEALDQLSATVRSCEGYSNKELEQLEKQLRKLEEHIRK